MHCKTFLCKDAYGLGERVCLNLNQNDEYEMNGDIYSKLVRLAEHSSGITVINDNWELTSDEVEELTIWLTLLRARFPYKTFWLFTKEKWKVCKHHEYLSCIDVLISGKFDKGMMTSEFKYRQSANQLAIDCQESLRQNRMVLFANNY
jgi:anaerobic ribonucleoside-triphosphate reductase activating protein